MSLSLRRTHSATPLSKMNIEFVSLMKNEAAFQGKAEGMKPGQTSSLAY